MGKCKTKRGKGAKPTTNLTAKSEQWRQLSKKYRWEERRLAYFDDQRRNQDGWVRQEETKLKKIALAGAEKALNTANLMLGSPIFTREVIQRHPDGTPIQTNPQPGRVQTR